MNYKQLFTNTILPSFIATITGSFIGHLLGAPTEFLLSCIYLFFVFLLLTISPIFFSIVCIRNNYFEHTDQLKTKIRIKGFLYLIALPQVVSMISWLIIAILYSQGLINPNVLLAIVILPFIYGTAASYLTLKCRKYIEFKAAALLQLSLEPKKIKRRTWLNSDKITFTKVHLLNGFSNIVLFGMIILAALLILTPLFPHGIYKQVITAIILQGIFLISSCLASLGIEKIFSNNKTTHFLVFTLTILIIIAAYFLKSPLSYIKELTYRKNSTHRINLSECKILNSNCQIEYKLLNENQCALSKVIFTSRDGNEYVQHIGDNNVLSKLCQLPPKALYSKTTLPPIRINLEDKETLKALREIAKRTNTTRLAFAYQYKTSYSNRHGVSITKNSSSNISLTKLGKKFKQLKNLKHHQQAKENSQTINLYEYKFYYYQPTDYSIVIYLLPDQVYLYIEATPDENNKKFQLNIDSAITKEIINYFWGNNTLDGSF